MSKKVLWIGDAGAPTGFGVVTHQVGERLVRNHDHDIHVLAMNYRGDHVETNLKLYVPTLGNPMDIYGQARYLELLGKIMPDAVVFLNDPAIVANALLNSVYDPQKAFWRGIQNEAGLSYKPPILAYLPIDGYDSPKTWDVLAQRCTRIAMSHFGQTQMPEAPVIWHGVDTTVFHPRDRKNSKRALGFDPDRFLVLRVDKNSYRKNYPDTWRALRPVLRRHSDIDVHFHCLPAAMDGYNLTAFINNDEDIRDRLTFSPHLTGWTGWGEEQLAMLYSAADLFISTSWGEGFGLTLLEAMASGTPVIAQDCSAISEVVGPGGILIPPLRPISAPQGQDQMLPDIAAFTETIERLYQGSGSRRKLAEKGVAHADQFSWDYAARAFNDLIEAT